MPPSRRSTPPLRRSMPPSRFAECAFSTRLINFPESRILFPDLPHCIIAFCDGPQIARRCDGCDGCDDATKSTKKDLLPSRIPPGGLVALCLLLFIYFIWDRLP